MVTSPKDEDDIGRPSRALESISGVHQLPPMETLLRDHLITIVTEPPTVVQIPEELEDSFETQKHHDIRRVTGVGGAWALAFVTVLILARVVLFGDYGTEADNQLFWRSALSIAAIILAAVLALQLECAFRHHRAILAVGSAVVLGVTHAAGLLFEDETLGNMTTYATMAGVTVVTIGFRIGSYFTAGVCLLGLVGGSLAAYLAGARPDWIIATYGYVVALGVGLALSLIYERQYTLQFFQSVLLAGEVEARRELNAELEAMSRTDALSGLANRRSFDDRLDSEWERMTRVGRPISLLFLDIDHFKRFNDSLGHREGDSCIAAVGRTVGAMARRAPDLAARYGGEEFVVLLPETDLEGARHLAAELLAEIDGLRITHPDSPTAPFVTVSIGVSSAIPSPEHEPRHLVETADQCLYQAKKEGRHRVISSAIRGDSLPPSTR